MFTKVKWQSQKSICDTENIFTMPGNAFHGSVAPYYYIDKLFIQNSNDQYR